MRRIPLALVCVVIGLSAAAPARATVQSGAADLVLGQPNFTSAQANYFPQSLGPLSGAALDMTTGRVFAVDTNNSRVLWWNSLAELTAEAPADGVLGEPDLNTFGGGTSQSKMFDPSGIEADAAGNLWVADQGNDRVLEFSEPLSNGMNATLVLGQPDFTTVVSGASQTQFRQPNGVAVDKSSDVWVTDSGNNRVLQFTWPLSDGMAASAVLGQPDFTSRGVGLSQSQLETPSDALVDSSGTVVWVADYGNGRVLQFTLPVTNGMNASLVLGEPDFTSDEDGTSQSVMGGPAGLTLDGPGDLWVVDKLSNRVLKFVPVFANGMDASLVLGQPDFSSSGQGSSLSQMNGPSSVGVDAYGDVGVADENNHRILGFSSATIVTGAAATFAYPEDTLGLKNPSAVLNSGGQVFVADPDNNRVLWWNSESSLTNDEPAAGVLGQPDFNQLTSGLSQSRLSNPFGMAVDASGNLWVADEGNNRVLEFQAPVTLGMNASLVLGQADFTTLAFAASQTQLDGPSSLRFDGSGNLWVADEGNNRVLKFLEAQFANGMAAALVLGQPDFTSDAAGLSQSQLALPAGVSVDASGSVWVADEGNNRLLHFSAPMGNGMNAALVLGQTDFTEAVCATTQNQVCGPTRVVLDGAGGVWVADQGNSRVLNFPAPLANGANAGAVLGEPDFTASSGGTSQNLMQTPYGVYVDALGSVWVADTDNNRAIEFKNALIGLTPSSAPFTASGVGVSTLQFNWSGSASLTYLAEISPSPVFASVLASSLTANTYAVFGATLALAANTTYYMQVSTNASGAGPWSAAASTATLAAVPSAAAFTAATPVSATLSWTPNNPAGTTYHVYYWTLGGSTTTVVTTTNTATLSGLTVATTYYARVRALNWGGVISAPSVTASTVTPAGAAPANPVLFAVYQTSITVSWASANSTGGYEADASTAANFTGLLISSATLAGSTTALTLYSPALAVNTTYYLRVGAIFGGTTVYANTSPPSTMTLAAPPSGLTLVNAYISSAAFTWSQGADPAGTSYRFDYWVVGGSTLTQAVVSASTGALTTLHDATTYYVDVQAVNGNGIASALTGFPVMVVTLPLPNVIESIGPGGGVLTLNPSQGPIVVSFPAGAFTSSVTVVLQTPLLIALPPPNSSAAMLTATDVGLQVTLGSDVQPRRPIEITLSYAGSNFSQFIPANLVIAQYDPAHGVWAPLGSTVNTAAQTVSAYVSDFLGDAASLEGTQSAGPLRPADSGTDTAGLFQIMQLTAASNLSAPKVYPNPFRPALGQLNITFVNLPANTTLKIYDLLGERVRELSADSAGIAAWDSKNSNGSVVASGVYFVLASSGGTRTTFKVAIQR